MKLSELLASTEVARVSGSPDPEIAAVVHDSRAVAPGALFVAVPGMRHDGGRFAGEALKKGAVAIVSEKQLHVGPEAACAEVPSARQALADLAGAYYGRDSRELLLIGVTGTNGKTSASMMIRDVLRAGRLKTGLIGTVMYNTGARKLPALRTTPEATDLHAYMHEMKNAGCDAAVLEVSSHAIALERVRGIAFNIAVFTNLTRDHLDYHYDMEHYFQTKARLFSMLKAGVGRSAVVNSDDKWGIRLLGELDSTVNPVRCGMAAGVDVQAYDVRIEADGTRFALSTPWGETEVRLHIPGRFNIHNALLAVAVGGLCGVNLQATVKALERLKGVPGRLEPVSNHRHRRVFVDYAHTDNALEQVLSALRAICPGRLIVAFGCGGNRDTGKRPRMGRMAAALADRVIITSDNPRDEDPADIASEVLAGCEQTHHVEVVLDRRTAIERALSIMCRGDIVLVAGKGHETYQEIAGRLIPFDDRQAVRAFFRQ